MSGNVRLVRLFLMRTHRKTKKIRKDSEKIRKDQVTIRENSRVLPGYDAMDAETAFQMADEIVYAKTGEHLSAVERAILIGSFDRKKYEEIGAEYIYSDKYLRQDIGPKLWKKLSSAFEERVTKINYSAVMLRRSRQRESVSEPVPEITLEQVRPDWDIAPNSSIFYGRERELARLIESTLFGCRLLTIYGIKGIGKSLLAVKLAEQVRDFDAVVWRSLKTSFASRPPLLSELQNALVQSLEKQLQQSNQDSASFYNYLENHRCLIVLDDWEAVLQDGSHDGLYREGCEEYQNFLRHVGTVGSLQSCLVIVTQEKPKDVENMEDNRHICTCKVREIEEEAGKNFFTPGERFRGSDGDLKRLVRKCGGNPFLIKRIVNRIHNEFNGNIVHFLEAVAHDPIWDIYELLHPQIIRLSEAEKDVLQTIFRLTENGGSATVSVVLENVESLVSRVKLRDSVIPSLLRRALVESESGHYSLPRLVMDYVSHLTEM